VYKRDYTFRMNVMGLLSIAFVVALSGSSRFVVLMNCWSVCSSAQLEL